MPTDGTCSAGSTGAMRVDHLASRPPLVFERRSRGRGAKGREVLRLGTGRGLLALVGPLRPAKAGGTCRSCATSLGDPSEVAHFAVRARTGTTLATLARVAGTRWGAGDCFETARSDRGLDQYEVRGWEPWHRHIALAMAAFAFVSVSATRTARIDDAHERARSRESRDPAADSDEAMVWPPPQPRPWPSA
ncbi:hypothetical protein ABT187_49470 [Streptomyces sp. NPDC001817]|uniref:hypothetical protein n=1 Tax=Streptomyces sp. NPDC001817 TaxID=3154398 RepID=UPI00331E1E93